MLEEQRGALCALCGEAFAKTLSFQRFCGDTCCDRYHREKTKREGIKRTFRCEWCDTEFRPKKVTYNRFCSRAHAHAAQKDGRALSGGEKRYPFSSVRVNICPDCSTPRFVRGSGNQHTACKSCLADRVAIKKAIRVEPQPRNCISCGSTFTAKGLRLCADCGVERRRQTKKKCRRKYRSQGNDDRGKIRKRIWPGAKYERVSSITVFKRDGWKCQLCGIATPRDLRGKHQHNSPELDHKFPLSKGGDHTYANCQCACRECNGLKLDHILDKADPFASLLELALTTKRGIGGGQITEKPRFF